MEYPRIPLCMVSKSQKRKMQTVLNKALRFIHSNEEEQLNSEQLHLKYGITPLNIFIFHKAQKVWNTIRTSENEQYNELITPQNSSHSWFPKSSIVIDMEPPQAIIM